jgi:hypothetical protein
MEDGLSGDARGSYNMARFFWRKGKSHWHAKFSMRQLIKQIGNVIGERDGETVLWREAFKAPASQGRDTAWSSVSIGGDTRRVCSRLLLALRRFRSQ